MMKIIVVDDEEDVQILFRQKFRKELKTNQVEFYFALSAEEALTYLQSLERTTITLIISDINMPGMNGLELLKIIKDNHQYAKVFMMTAYSDDQRQKIAISNKADEYMTKPVNFEELKEKIFNLLTI